MGAAKFALFSAIVAAIFLSHFAPTASQEVENEKEFSYDMRSETGPERWGQLKKEWEACNNGRLQSPIDLSDERVQVLPLLGRLRRCYRPAMATMKNRGHDIMLKWTDGAGSIFLNRTEYTLKQLHWHSPSEHTIGGRSFPLEMHMVHMSADGKIAVVGFLYTFGHPDAFLAELEEYMHAIEGLEKEEEQVGMVDPKKIKRGSRKYYRYLGSLTTPPCTEGVVWTIVKKVRTVSKEQVSLLRGAVNDNYEMNARPVQPTYKRVVQFFRPQNA